MQNPKIRLQIDNFFLIWVVFTVSSFVGNPVHLTTEPIVPDLYGEPYLIPGMVFDGSKCKDFKFTVNTGKSF